MRDLIFVSLEDWDEIWRRNQFLCAGLARRFPQMKILFVGLPRNVSNHIRHGTLRELRQQATWTVPNLPNVTVTHALKLLPDSIGPCRKINEAMMRAHVRSVAGRLGLRDPLLWLNPHSAVHMIGRMGERGVVYDITDDWASAPSFTETERRRIVAQDRELCARADLTIVCSEWLHESRQGKCRQLLLLPNGVEYEHYAGVALGREAEEKWPGPVFGYTGTLHSDRFDVALAAEVGKAFPHGSVVLVGPDHLSSEEKARLQAAGNVHVTGSVPYSRIPETMRQFDVCIVPHVETKFTNSLNPLKLWEYLAAGKPIVSTSVSGFRDYPDHCRISSGAANFVQACRDALAENGAGLAARQSLARQHSWDERIRLLLETLQAEKLIAS